MGMYELIKGDDQSAVAADPNNDHQAIDIDEGHAKPGDTKPLKSLPPAAILLPPSTQSKRLVSLDVFRGLTVAVSFLF